MIPSDNLIRKVGRFPWMLWGALGMVMLLTQGGIAWLSHFFVFGEGHAERPILKFLALEGIAFAGYFFAVEWIRKQGAACPPGRVWLEWILGVSILCRLFFFSSQLIQETDPYRYIWDGQAVLQGTNPFLLSPHTAFENKQAPLPPNEEALSVFRKINHPGVPTIYPPLAQGLFAAAQIISPWNLTGWRILILTADILTLLLLCGLLKKLKLSPSWLLIYAWSPLVLKEFSNSLHLDVFAVFFLAGMMVAVASRKIIFSFVCLALAVLTKISPVVLLPLLFTWFYRAHPRRTVFGGIVFFSLIGLFYLPYLEGGAAIFQGLNRFAHEWRVNEGIYEVIHSAIRSLGLSGSLLESMSRFTAALGVIGIVAGVCFWLNRQKNVTDFFKACGIALAALFFLAPTGNPWYFTWILPFLIFYPSRVLILFSGLVLLYYLDFYFLYQGNPGAFKYVRILEYGVFFAFLGWEFGRYLNKQANFHFEVNRAPQEFPKVSIILAVMNEKNLIRETLAHLLGLGADEVIVVDGSSADGTDKIVRQEFPAARFFQTAFPDRSLQMNLGAFEASGDIFLFVHADMKLPSGAIHSIQTYAQQGYVGGGFMKRYIPETGLFKFYAFLQNWLHLAWMKCMVGTNAMFVTRDTFRKMNGFHDQPFLEDVLFSDCLNRYGSIAVIQSPVSVSARRYLEKGFINQVIKNASIMIRHKMLRQDPSELQEIYGTK